MWDGDNTFEYLTTVSQGANASYYVINSSGVVVGDDVFEGITSNIFEKLSEHYGVSINDGGSCEYESASEIQISDIGQIWLGEGTAPTITALSLEDMNVGTYVPVTVNDVIGSLANVLCLITKVNDNTVNVDVCLGGEGEGCFVWDGTQLRYLADSSVSTSALSTVVASALSESEHREINIGTIGTDESYTQARPARYVGAAEPVELPFNVVVNQGVLSGQHLGVVKPLVFNGKINNPSSDYLCIANAEDVSSGIELTSNDTYTNCDEVQDQDFDSVIECSNQSASADDGFVVTAYNSACTFEESIGAIEATLSVLFENREICKIANCGNSSKPYIYFE